MNSGELYDYAIKRSPITSLDPISVISKRAYFYGVCNTYENRFNCEPPEPLFDQLWLMSEQKWRERHVG